MGWPGPLHILDLFVLWCFIWFDSDLIGIVRISTGRWLVTSRSALGTCGINLRLCRCLRPWRLHGLRKRGTVARSFVAYPHSHQHIFTGSCCSYLKSNVEVSNILMTIKFSNAECYFMDYRISYNFIFDEWWNCNFTLLCSHDITHYKIFLREVKRQKSKFTLSLQLWSFESINLSKIKRGTGHQTTCRFSGLCDKPLLPMVSGFEMSYQMRKKAACSKPRGIYFVRWLFLASELLDSICYWLIMV